MIAYITSAQITVTTSPPGQQITVDNVSYTAPQTFNWTPGSPHTLSTPASQFSADQRTQYTFASWSDGGDQSHQVTTPSSTTTYTAIFTTQYLLDTTVTPTGSGSIDPSPSGPWYNPNQGVQLTAHANAGYTFANWSGDCAGQGNPCSLTMSSPKSATATFTLGPARWGNFRWGEARWGP